MKSLKGIEDLDPRISVVKETASVIPWLIKFAVVGIVGYIGYKSFVNRFKNKSENPAFPKANITQAEAQTRADSIANAGSFNIPGSMGSQFSTTSDMISGLNYNGFIRLYNAFGEHSGLNPFKKMNLIEFIQDQFSAYEIKQLSFLQNGAFF